MLSPRLPNWRLSILYIRLLDTYIFVVNCHDNKLLWQPLVVVAMTIPLLLFFMFILYKHYASFFIYWSFNSFVDEIYSKRLLSSALCVESVLFQHCVKTRECTFSALCFTFEAVCCSLKLFVWWSFINLSFLLHLKLYPTLFFKSKKTIFCSLRCTPLI